MEGIDKIYKHEMKAKTDEVSTVALAHSNLLAGERSHKIEKSPL